MSRRKQLWVLAGGNGAGKTTYYQQFLKPRGLAFINADILAKQLDAYHPEKMSYHAARMAEQLRRELLKTGMSFCFETVFSHPSKVDFIAEAKALGYEVILVCIHLENDALNQARVSQRVARGGHDVPADKIITRIPRTLANVRKALPLVDWFKLYDNSSQAQPYRSIAVIKHGKLEIEQGALPHWAQSLLADYLE